MAKTIGLYSLAAPTGLTPSLVAGGTLAPNTTYYYKIFACELKFGVVVFSPRTATVSITTTTTSKSIKLTWTAIPGYSPSSVEGNCYHILRNTVDSFLDTDPVLMMNSSSDTISRRVTGVTYTDTGSNHVDHYIPNFKGGLPVIYVSTGADEWVSLRDIYLADVAAGWGRVFPAINPAFVDFGSDKAPGGTWCSMANLAIGYDATGAPATGYFTHLAGALTIWGALSSSEAAYIKFGSVINTADADSRERTFLINYGASFQTGTLNGVLSLCGLSHVIGGAGFPADLFQYNNGGANNINLNPSAGSVIYDCDFPMVANGWPALGTAEVNNCRYSGLALGSATHIVKNPKITDAEGLGLRLADNQIAYEPTVTYAGYDVAWKTQYNQTIYDGTFLSHNRTDGKVWLYLALLLNTGGSLTFKYSCKLRVSDSNDTPLSGASVEIKDNTGTTISSGDTDAEGNYDAGYLTNRALFPTADLGGALSRAAALEDDHIAAGDLTRTDKNPYTIVITKAGFQTYQDTITIDRKLNLRVALQRLNLLPVDGGLMPLGIMEVVA